QAWKGFRSTQRNEMRKFEAAGIECVVANEHASIEKFVAVEEATHKRHRAQGKQQSLMAPRTLDLFWKMVVHPGRVRAYFALRDGLPLSTVVVGICGSRMYLIHSGSTPEGLAIYASKGLLWHVLKREYER